MRGLAAAWSCSYQVILLLTTHFLIACSNNLFYLLFLLLCTLPVMYLEIIYYYYHLIRTLVAYSRGIPREFPGNGEVPAIWGGTPVPQCSRTQILQKYDVTFFRPKSLFNSLKERPQ